LLNENLRPLPIPLGNTLARLNGSPPMPIQPVNSFASYDVRRKRNAIAFRQTAAGLFYIVADFDFNYFRGEQSRRF
jgi:hypothetical protein